MKRGSLLSYAAVALATAILSVSAGMWMSPVISGVHAAENGGGNTTLLTQPLADLPGREVRMTLLERDPLVASAPHRHPGHYTFGYIAEGTYEFGVNGQPPRLLHAGDVFFEPPGALHSTSRNASPEKKLKIVIFMVAETNNPSTVAEPASVKP
jgi:quercetin dioxygenase-like cupin family protein